MMARKGLGGGGRKKHVHDKNEGVKDGRDERKRERLIVLQS